jgi:hypothetical protein
LFKYAQIDIGTGRCISVSELAGEVEAENMIPLFEWVEVEQQGEPDEDGNPTTILVPELVLLDIEVNPNDTYEGGVWTPAPPPEPLSVMDAKISELNAACNAAILAGFTSDALGEPHTYSFDQEAQTNLGGMYSAILGGLVTTSQNWRASGVPVPHTVDQLKTLFAHGLYHKNANIGRYQYLEALVLAGETPLEDIVW